jgi:hypothetical protein
MGFMRNTRIAIPPAVLLAVGGAGAGWFLGAPLVTDEARRAGIAARRSAWRSRSRARARWSGTAPTTVSPPVGTMRGGSALLRSERWPEIGVTPISGYRPVSSSSTKSWKGSTSMPVS